MRVLFESSQVVVVDKPAGITTIPDRTGSDSVHGMLERARGEKLWIVHRLDREVTGVLAFARDPAIHRYLSMAFESHAARKTYAARTGGSSPGDPGCKIRWENKLLRGKKRSYPSPHGKLAITEAVWDGGRSGDLRWTLYPLTGRNHQLRVHLAQAGYPIHGDHLYGSDHPWKPGGDEGTIALRAVRLQIPGGDGFSALDVAAPPLH